MAPFNLLMRVLLTFEDKIIATILRSPGFHRGVGRIHRMIHERKYGRDPHEPLRPGEATEVPGQSSRFRSYFLQELKNQWKGKPTNTDAPPPKRNLKR